MAKKSKHNVGGALGAGLALLAAGAAAYYFLGGKKGKARRAKLGAWTKEAQRQVLARVKALRAINKRTYSKAVDDVLKHYRSMRDVSSREVGVLAEELKGHWSKIEREVKRKVSKELGGAKRE